jgi:hypothetical protein
VPLPWRLRVEPAKRVKVPVLRDLGTRSNGQA